MTSNAASIRINTLKHHLTQAKIIANQLGSAHWNNADQALALRDGIVQNSKSSIRYAQELDGLLAEDGEP